MTESISLFEGIFRHVPVDAMPDEVWLQYAWLCAAGSEVFAHTVIQGVSQGTLCVQCTHASAVEVLNHPEPILERLRLCGCRRRLPRIDRIRVSVCEIVSDAENQKPREPRDPDPARLREALEATDDPELARLLALMMTDSTRGF